MADRHTGNHREAAPSVPGDLIAWRRGILEAAGFAPGLADVLTAEADCDLHRLLDLVDRGCPPALAARILAPL